MRVFQALLVIMGSTILFLLPLTAAAYAFKTDRQSDAFSVHTNVGQTTQNITLSEVLYDADVSTINVLSNLTTDIIAWSSYNATTNHLLISGMTANATRTLTASYDADALDDNAAIIALADKLAWFWLLICIAFAPAALAAIFLGRA